MITFLQLIFFCVLYRCLSKDISEIKVLPSKNAVRLTQNLTHVIGLAMDASDTPEMPMNAVMPWILLYRLVKL